MNHWNDCLIRVMYVFCEEWVGGKKIMKKMFSERTILRNVKRKKTEKVVRMD